MEEKNVHLDTLQDIKQMMERSSRFISLSGLSGIGAGICALGGAFFTLRMISSEKDKGLDYRQLAFDTGSDLQHNLLLIGGITFVAALMVAFIFTYMRSVRTGNAIWGTTSRRLLWNTMIPLAVGGMVTLRFLQLGYGGLIAPTCLLFYGLALINGSKYTLTEIRWLGFSELLLGIVNLWMIGYGLLFWAFGFGVLHIVYGAIMWWKYEKK
ncbi:MAG: hypothetical protein JWQ30_343 [Sediminibacterium sp.]|nr:hypothetical protein [Sediminibacterium sp.]